MKKFNGEIEYLKILKRILKHGQWKGNRTGTKTIMIPNQILNHSMSEGFPLLTTKKIAWKSTKVELEGFIGGITDKNWFKENGNNWWSDWCNPEIVPYGHDDETINRMKECNDLGCIYSWQWRRQGKEYINGFPISTKLKPIDDPIDQLNNIVNTLKTNPDDRRMVVDCWVSNQLSQMALPACHISWTLSHCNNILNLCWTQRSCDMFLGVPCNLASYALLLHLLCKETDMVPGLVTGMLIDCHIYQNHIVQCDAQLSKTRRVLPTIQTEGFTSIFDWENIETPIIKYNPHPTIKAPIAI